MGRKARWKRYGFSFLLMTTAALLLRVRLAGYLVCVVAWCFVCFKWRKWMKEAYRQKIRLQEASLYMEQMLYAFLQQQKILSALEDVCPLFEKGEMRTVIEQAIEAIYHHGSPTEDALEKIEQAYENQRILEMHRYLLSVEKYGGEYEAAVQLLLDNEHQWMERVRIYQHDCKKYQRNVCIAVALSVLVCAITNALLPGDMVISTSPFCQVASVLLIVLDMCICLSCAKKTCKDWLKGSVVSERADYRSLYQHIKTHGGIRSFFYRKELKRGIEQAFPQWLMDISLLLQTENVQVALYKTKEKAPRVLQPAIGELLQQLERNPESIVPYQNFLKEFGLSDVQSAMRMLYALSNGGYGNGEGQMRQIMQRNQEFLDKSERAKNEDALAGFYVLFLTPALTGAGKMLIDMTVFLVVFLARAGI